ncbi:MAG: serine hydrolase [Acidobacteriaceae bacterium]|nr:serine hydrolase [Acidobacteriaceae bacterium]
MNLFLVWARFALKRPLLMGMLAAYPCHAQDTARMDQIVQSYVTDKKFMGTVLVARDKVLFSKGYGMANLEWNIPNAPDVKFRLGSITKQFTAASILLLEERGKLSTNDPVKKYMPDAPATWDKITIYHLLTHTSGIPSFTGLPAYSSLEAFAITPEKLVALFRDKPLEFQPGEKWNYSNSGYALLGYLIEKISGQSYPQFLQENILTPLGMKDSGYDSNTAIIARRASGYTAASGGIENSGFINMTVPFSAGALYSTTEDLLRWEQGLFGGKILSPAELQKMTTPFKNNYACGLFVSERKGKKLIQHGGGIEGFNTSLAYYPDDKLTVIALANLNGSAPDEITAELGDVVHGEPVRLPSERKELELSPAILSRYVGTYDFPGGAKMLIMLTGDQLYTKLASQPQVAIYPESEKLFFAKVVDAEIEFVTDKNGAVTNLILHQNGMDQTAPRISAAVEVPPERKAITVPVETLKQYVGTYELAPGVDIDMTLDGDQLMTQVTGQPKFPLFAETTTRFFLKVVDAQVDFVKDADGKVNNIVLHQNGMDHTAARK